jgi:hypothetical protein
LAGGVIQHFHAQPRIETNPEGIVHDPIRIGQVTGDTVVAALKIGLAGEIAAEEQAGGDFVPAQMTQQLYPRDAGRGPSG